MRHLAWVIGLGLGTGCATAPAHPETAQIASAPSDSAGLPPAGWWIEASSPPGATPAEQGMAFRFEPHLLVRITNDAEVDQVAAEIEPAPTGFTVHGATDSQLVRQGAGWAVSADGAAIALRAATPAETARLRAALSSAPALGPLCAQALACCREGMKSLGGTCNPSQEFERVWSSHGCRIFISGMTEIARLKEVRLPTACAPGATQFASSPLPPPPVKDEGISAPEAPP